MKRDEAMAVLGLDKAACALTPEIVTRAFRIAVVACHPDTAEAGKACHDMTKLLAAKKALLNDSEQQNNACAQCRGVGTVRYKLGVRPCGACKGTGDKNGR